MARKLVNGTVPYIGSAFGTSKAFTGISNASSAVFAFETGHGIAVGDFFQINTCGWASLAGRVFRASAVDTDNVTVAGLDTSSTTRFPAAGGAGTAAEVSTWVAMQQVNADGLSVEGGETEYYTGQDLDDVEGLKFQLPIGKTPIVFRAVVDDDQSLTYWTAVHAAEDAKTNYPLKLVYPGSTGVAVGTGLWNVSAAPDMKGNSVQKRTITVGLARKFSEYTS